MKGDANEFADVLDYIVPVESTAWVPRLTIPGGGDVVSRVTSPAVAVPLLCGLIGLVGVVWLIPPPARRGGARVGVPA
jgi:signal peptidase